MKKALFYTLFLGVFSTGVAQINIVQPIPKYGCPNVTHSVTLKVTNTSGFPLPAGYAYTVVTVFKNDVGTTLTTNSQTFSDGIAIDATKSVTIPSIPFQGAMVCAVEVTVNYTYPAAGTYSTTSTYTVQAPPVFTISETPAGTLTVTTALDSYLVRYYKDADYLVVVDESATGTYNPPVLGNYTAKAYEPVSGCLSATASNAVSLSVTALKESQKVKVAVYPNPMATSVTLSTENPNTLRYELYDVQGRLAVFADFTSVVNVNVEGLQAGTYMLVIKDNAEQVASYKLVK